MSNFAGPTRSSDDASTRPIPHQGARADAIVVAYRSREVLEECVRSLRRDPAVGQILVVNNSPGDGADAVVGSVPGVIFVESPENLGFGRAINQVRDRVESAYVVLANPDTCQQNCTVTSSIAFLESKPRAAIMGPRIVTSSGKFYSS